MTSIKAKEKARLGYLLRQFNKRYRFFQEKYIDLFIDFRKAQDDKLNYALRVDDLQLRLATSQGELIKTSSSFLTMLNKTQTSCTDIVNKFISQHKETLREVKDLNKKKLHEEKCNREVLEETNQSISRQLQDEIHKRVKAETENLNLKQGEEHPQVQSSLPLLVKHSPNHKEVPVKKISKPPNLEPRRMKNYVRYITTVVNTVDDFSYMENFLAEHAITGTDGLLENDEASIDESDDNRISGDDFSDVDDNNAITDDD